MKTVRSVQSVLQSHSKQLLTMHWWSDRLQIYAVINTNLFILNKNCLGYDRLNPLPSLKFLKWWCRKTPVFVFVCFAWFQLIIIITITHFYAAWNLVTALVPSETACLASSPGRRRRTAVWISRDDKVDFLLYLPRRDDSRAILSNISLMNEFKMEMPLFDMPVEGCTCFNTL